MSRTLSSCMITIGLSVLVGCGGGSSEPADIYLGAWKSSCHSYVGRDGKTYFKTYIADFSKTSPTSIKGVQSDSLAHSDPACRNVLGPIANSADVAIQLGPKATFLGSEVDTITFTLPDASFSGFMTANSTQLFFVTTNNPNETPSGWGASSPFQRVASGRSLKADLQESAATNDLLAPASPLDAY